MFVLIGGNGDVYKDLVNFIIKIYLVLYWGIGES